MKDLYRPILLSFVLLLFVIGSADAKPATPQEQVRINGAVKDEAGESIVGATVFVKENSAIGAVVDEQGRYTLTVPVGTTLNASFLGFETLERKVVKGILHYDFILKEESHKLDEVIVIGYGEVKKSDLTGSVSTVGARNFGDQPVKSVSDILQGRSSGVEVTTVSGMPGASAKVRIRGTTSINKSSDPLYVIDGIISSSGLDGLNPQDIQSMEILKDASSTAVYGSRGANGVVLVTTKGGEQGRARVWLDTKVGVSDVRKNYNLLNPYEYALALNDIKGAGMVSDDDLEAYRTGEKGINWVDLMTRTAITQNYNLGISGGAKRVRYLISGNMLDQEAVTINSKYMRYGVRANIDADVRRWLSVSMKLNGSILHQKNGAPNWFHVLNFSPTMELRDPVTGIYNNDPYNIGTGYNPYGVMTENYSDSYSYNLNANARLLFKIAKGLTLSVQGGYDYDHAPSYAFSSSKLAPGATSSMSNASAMHRYWQNTNNLAYSGTFNGHTISANAVWEMSGVVDTALSISGSGLSNESVGYWDVGNAAVRSESNGYTESSLLSGIVRLNYDYKKRYFITAAFRADGSSKFQKGNRWGFFPSAAVAWDIAQENFMKNQKVVEHLKIRASYGVTGNEGISAYSTLGMLSATSYGWGTSTGYTGYWGNTFATPNLTWEKTTQYDVGLDFTIYGINFSFDWFKKSTVDLLFQKQVPYYNGGGTFWVNQGALDNTGFELSLNTFVVDRAVKWETSVNATYIKNTIVDLAGNDFVLTSNYSDLGGAMSIMKPGYPLGSFYVYDWVGFNDEGANLYRKADGTLTTAPTSSDLVIKGQATPKWTLGWNNTISWRGLSLNIFFNGAFGMDRLNMSRFTTASMSGVSRFITLRDAYFYGWDHVEDKSKAKYPSVKNSDNKSYANSDFWLEDASFFKLKNITLSYMIPRYVTRFAEIHLSVSAQDLFTITKYQGMDPEVYNGGDGLDYGAYPVPRTFTFGVKLVF
ncbi:MAG: TonB-dependent receptor [Rikenellaceae bacterium]|nr:TonB-dependent receptor [Rikenellaceae bacterium]